MQAIQQFFILVILFLTPFRLWAEGSQFRFEPIYGIETSLVRYPEPPHYVTRGTYGARALYGTTLLSGEAEYTTARSHQTLGNPDREIDDVIQRGNLGVRSTFPMNQYFSAYLRGGGSANKGETKVTTAGVSETHTNNLRFDPYAGAGLHLGFDQLFSLTAGATLIRNAIGKYDTQYTLGVSAGFGSK